MPVSASLIPEISCIMPIVPFDYVMEGTTNSFKRLGRSVYTWHGQDVPYSPWAFKNMLPAEKKYPRECEEARQDSFRRILAFLEGWN